MQRQQQSPWLYIGIALIGSGIFAADLVTPLGLAVWILYVVPIALTLLGRYRDAPTVAALVSTLLMGITVMTDAPGVTPSVAYINRACGVVVIWAIAILARMLLVTRARLEEEAWIRKSQTAILEQLQGERSMTELGHRTLTAVGSALDAPAGAVYTPDGTRLTLAASMGLGPNASLPESFTFGEGLIGEAARGQKTVVLSDLDDSFFTVRSALGATRPRHIIVTPLIVDGQVQGVMEIGMLHRPDARALALLERTRDSVAVAIRSVRYRDQLRVLLAETQGQAEELQTQQEELRVANEELEEHGKVLKASQARLEQQQAELEATNAQLESYTQTLEQQAQALAASQREAERANRYKSEFLANMSHELRTPLNSALILAKLLADNKGRRLSEDEVRYAETIYAAGNTLLTLINDILDLSKIEAGAVAVEVETVPLPSLVDAVRRTFDPIAADKRLSFAIDVDPAAPPSVRSDPQRLQQVLTNLLSNAFKFTDAGVVTLRVRPQDGRLAFEVSDTGAGIEADKFDVIFQAFRQADGSTHRRQGGTGLGLSIALELAHRLGGDITVRSQVGAGSTFTFVVPLELPAAVPAPPRVSTPSPPGTALPPRHAVNPRPSTLPAGIVADDRSNRTRPGRLILVVEDDPLFARVLYDLAHELDFDCAIATSTEEAMALARELAPIGVLLDVELPDGSGLTLLDRLKHNPDTRHVPVHVISVADNTKTALELGAVGYALKPVDREAIVGAIRKLEARFEHRLHRVLVVEDDPQLRESIRELLQIDGVVIEGAGSAADALERLSATSFDCVVLDLTLPDQSGYEILETMSASERYSFPPVVIYTGQAPSPEDEERLRRYSRSVIVKGARSPERLLDEVTLFLHQVESRLPPASQRMLRAARERDELFEGKTVLIVEDDVRNIFALSSVFESRGATVTIARNGREALARIAEKRPDLVLMDVMMPEMDGLTATRELRKSSALRDLPVITLTAKAMPDDYAQSIAAGANDYMAKPIDVDKLVSLCRVWMTR